MHRLTMLALLLACGAAQADQGPITAADVASWCQPFRTAILSDGHISMQGTSDSQVCYGAFMAIQQLAATTLSSKNDSVLKACVPANVGLVEIIKVFLHYADEHPERGHDKFTDIVLSSLWTAYPCRAPARPK
jgi:hypothetical protein